MHREIKFQAHTTAPEMAGAPQIDTKLRPAKAGLARPDQSRCARHQRRETQCVPRGPCFYNQGRRADLALPECDSGPQCHTNNIGSELRTEAELQAVAPAA